MFARQNRLPNERAVKRLYAKGKRSTRSTVFFFTAPTNARLPRVAVVAGRKVSNSAVERNRLKRVARAQIEAMLPTLRLADYLLVVRPAGKENEAGLRADIDALLKEHQQ